MADEYEKSYLLLFNAVTDALDALRAKNIPQARAILINAQQRAEETFIETGETERNVS